MSLEELQKQQKSTRRVGGLWIGLLLIMAVIAGVSTYQKGVTGMTALPLIFLPLALVSAGKLKRIRTELRLRSE